VAAPQTRQSHPRPTASRRTLPEDRLRRMARANHYFPLASARQAISQTFQQTSPEAHPPPGARRGWLPAPVAAIRPGSVARPVRLPHPSSCRQTNRATRRPSPAGPSRRPAHPPNMACRIQRRCRSGQGHGAAQPPQRLPPTAPGTNPPWPRFRQNRPDREPRTASRQTALRSLWRYSPTGPTGSDPAHHPPAESGAPLRMGRALPAGRGTSARRSAARNPATDPP